MGTRGKKGDNGSSANQRVQRNSGKATKAKLSVFNRKQSKIPALLRSGLSTQDDYVQDDVQEAELGVRGEDEGNMMDTVDDNTRRAFAGQVKKAVKEADVVIEVLDARDPQFYRCESLEKMVVEAGKTLVLLLNKIDLVEDQKVVEAWEQHLKKEFPVCCFRAMTSRSRAKTATVKFNKVKATHNCPKVLSCGYSPLGAADLMNLLNNYTRLDAKSDKPADEDPHVAERMETSASEDEGAGAAQTMNFRSIVVSIVGFPNVGKSSIINSLLRNTASTKTGNMPGVTRRNQTIKLTKKIRLLDTPGVIMQQTSIDAHAILHGCIAVFDERLGEEAVRQVLTASRNHIFAYFGFPDDAVGAIPDTFTLDHVRKFLAAICEKRHLLLKGGGRDLKTATKVVIGAWNSGNLKVCALPMPPTDTPAKDANAEAPAKWGARSGDVVKLGVQVMPGPSAELDLDNL